MIQLDGKSQLGRLGRMYKISFVYNFTLPRLVLQLVRQVEDMKMLAEVTKISPYIQQHVEYKRCGVGDFAEQCDFNS